MSWSIQHLVYIAYFLGIFAAISNAQDTSPPSRNSSIVFPEQNEVLWRTGSNGIHLLGVSILAYCLARRTDKFSARGLTSIPIARWLVILIFIDSWFFLFAAGLLISGIGMSLNARSCEAGIFLCIVLYAISKILIYWFLVEKVHLVHPHPSHSRRSSPAYRICMLFVVGYGIIIIIAIHSRIAFIRNGHQISPVSDPTINDGACIIGLGRTGSMSVLVYDLILTVFINIMFLHPLYKSSNLPPRVKAIAKRTLIAASVALVTSAVNICILTILHGEELGWICLASCGADVAINAIAVYIVTAAVDDQNAEPCEPPEKSRIRDSEMGFDNDTARGLDQMVSISRPHPAYVLPGANPLYKGILEKHCARPSEVLSPTRSVHFSPETTRQSRGSALREVKDASASQVRSEGTLVESFISVPKFSQLPEEHETDRASGSDSGSQVEAGRRRTIDVHAGPSVYPHVQRSSEAAPQERGEETLVEVRHEAPLKRSSRRNSLVSFTASTSRKRSKSIEEPNASPQATVVSLSHAPSTLDEARERIRVLSALTEIAGERNKSQADQNLLEVSVVTETNRRIEVRKKPPRNDRLDDFHGRRYDRRGNSFSSSGGL